LQLRTKEVLLSFLTLTPNHHHFGVLADQVEISGCIHNSIHISTSSKSSTHYLNDTVRFVLWSKGPLSELSAKEGPLLKTLNLTVSFGDKYQP
jgi:hypothetical protein